MSQHPSWFTEAHQASGSSIGYRVEKLLHAEKTPFQTIEIYQTTDWGATTSSITR
jgi:spermidine synthase